VTGLTLRRPPFNNNSGEGVDGGPLDSGDPEAPPSDDDDPTVVVVERPGPQACAMGTAARDASAWWLLAGLGLLAARRRNGSAS
jgi:MYXO-CTERM domain-containing protein